MSAPNKISYLFVKILRFLPISHLDLKQIPGCTRDKLIGHINLDFSHVRVEAILLKAGFKCNAQLLGNEMGRDLPSHKDTK